MPEAPASLAVLRDRARQLEQQAAQLRQLAQAVHQRQVLAELAQACCSGKEEDIDLVYAALLIARLDNEEVDVDGLPQRGRADGPGTATSRCPGTPTTRPSSPP